MKYPDILFIVALIPLFYGPLLYFYVRSLLGKVITRRMLLLHAIPIVSTYLIFIPFIFQSQELKLIYYSDKYIKLPFYVSVQVFIRHLSAPIYFIWIIKMLRKNRVFLKNTYSSIDNLNLRWMQNLLKGAITLWIIDTIWVYIINYTYLDIPYFYSWYIKCGFVVFILIIGYYGIKQGNVFTSYSPKGSENNKSKDLNNNKLIPDKLAKQHADALINYIQNEKVFLNNELRIQDISIKLNIPVHIISYVINDKLDQNFYDLINNFRIEEIKSRLINPKFENLTIVAIAYDCGFNSKATFNRLFKKYTGTTPTQYKNRSHH